MRFEDRREAGLRLAARLREHRPRSARQGPPVVVGLAGAGVPVAEAVATALDVGMDALGIAELADPGRPGTCLGALAEGGARYLDPHALAVTRITPAALRAIGARARTLLEGRVARMRAIRSRLALHGRTAILVDDAIASSVAMRAAIRAIRALRPRAIVLAAPAVARAALDEVAYLADDAVWLEERTDLAPGGAAHADDELLAILAASVIRSKTVQGDSWASLT